MRAIVYTAKTTEGKSLKIVRDLLQVQDFEHGINQAIMQFITWGLENGKEIDVASVKRHEIN
jgi:hypothetical protein